MSNKKAEYRIVQTGEYHYAQVRFLKDGEDSKYSFWETIDKNSYGEITLVDDMRTVEATTELRARTLIKECEENRIRKEKMKHWPPKTIFIPIPDPLNLDKEQ